MNYTEALKGSSAALVNLATATISMREPALSFWETAREQATLGTLARVGAAAGLSGWASTFVTRRALIPRSNMWHVSGAQLLQGREALAEARRRSLTKEELASEMHALSLHPDWVVSKKLLARHMFIYGSVGSGKSVILKHLLAQAVEQDKKLFCFDIKGDFTSIFRKPIIVCPFDKRSYVWDIGRDCATQTQAAAFAQTIIQAEEGAGAFWATAAQAILEGCVRELQATKGKEWGWADLATLLARPAQPMFQALSLYFPRAATLIANPDSNTTSSVLACVANGTAIIERLATAWPQRNPDRSFSMLDWIRDDYTGRKQVIVQSGPDELLARSYISAMINVAVPEIIGPSLPDDESGRFLGFFFDELTAAGKLNIEPLLALGRSKGVVAVMACQDWSQVEKVYGDKTAQAFSGLVGTHIICQLQVGETRDKLSGQLGKRTVAWRTHDDKATVHEESKAIVGPGKLTDDLGFRKGKAYGPERWGIRAIVQTSGDLLLLDWPGASYPKVREGQKRARWTREGAQPVKQNPMPTNAAEGAAEIQQLLKLTADQAAAELEKRGATPPRLRAVSDDELEAIFKK
ncbi:type IV secretion system DNA-binding domain-containing protein [Stenotrophomonas maltophilia]|uniref:type IV secretion system DNA-binding domain-containing protein n=1 Tax=Stenotrophomonas maltophilia TaxID=40324 RepID=UPI00209B6A10|nr:type IV secretion system DNA-binding domain-containing protein [Stenotrophomonas maltophilia]MCO7473066.1 type IV secretion system DNA-binding domain-containing protein [Stenotrophomonas maltophilia]